MAYPTFNPEAGCPKCGHDDVRTRHVPDAGHPSWESPPCGSGTGYRCPEHLDRTCERCLYAWMEDVMEHAGRPAGEGE